MILVDDRAGSKPIHKLLVAAGIPAELTRLEFGDFAFAGNGPDNASVAIGVEYKTLGDLINSVRTGRLTGHQLPGMRRTYAYSWLIIEGDWRSNEHGQICTWRGPKHGWQPMPGRLSVAELEKRLIGLEVRAGVYVWPTRDRASTVRYLVHLYRSLTDGPWQSHTSHLAPHAPLLDVSAFRAAVMTWPGVGLAVSKAAEATFGSVKCAATASIADWAKLVTLDAKGGKRTFGEAHARKVIEFLVKAR